MSDIEVIDLISFANDNKPVDFASGITDMLGQKALSALSQYKQAVAQSMFDGSEAQDEDSELEYDENEYQEYEEQDYQEPESNIDYVDQEDSDE